MLYITVIYLRFSCCISVKVWMHDFGLFHGDIYGLCFVPDDLGGIVDNIGTRLWFIWEWFNHYV